MLLCLIQPLPGQCEDIEPNQQCSRVFGNKQSIKTSLRVVRYVQVKLEKITDALATLNKIAKPELKTSVVNKYRYRKQPATHVSENNSISTGKTSQTTGLFA